MTRPLGGTHHAPHHVPPLGRAIVRSRAFFAESDVLSLLTACSLAQIIAAAEQGTAAAFDALRRIYCCEGGWNREERRQAGEALDRLQFGDEAREYSRRALAACLSPICDEVAEAELELRRGR